MFDDDLFEVLRGLAGGTPSLLLVFVLIGALLLLLTFVKHSVERRLGDELWVLDNPALPERCCFPPCGALLPQDTQAEAVYSKFNEHMSYCSHTCRKRDVSENNHKSVVLLLRYRAEELQRLRAAEDAELGKGLLEKLSDLVPNPQAMFDVDGDDLCSKISLSVEHDAALLTSRRFAEAYVSKYGLAVHHRAWECFQKSCRGCLLVHLSERALEHSKGSPLSFVPQWLLAQLRDKKLSEMVREYVPERQLVLYVLQRGVEKRHIAIPFSYTVYPAGKPASNAPPPSEGAQGAQPPAADAASAAEEEAEEPAVVLPGGEEGGGGGVGHKAQELRKRH